MDKKFTSYIFMSLFLLVFLLLPGCKQDSATDGGLQQQQKILELEKAFAQLQAENKANTDRIENELVVIYKELESIQSLLQSAQDTEQSSPHTQDEVLKDKAKGFVSKSMDHLFSITEELLDSLESQLKQERRHTNPKNSDI